MFGLSLHIIPYFVYMNKDGFSIVLADLEYSLLLDNGMVSKASCTKLCVFIILWELLWCSS